MSRRPAVFLDRDGTLVEEREYLADPDGVRLVPGALDALAALARVEVPVVIVTNQSGIARGLYTEDDYHAVAARLQSMLEDAGVPPLATLYCPHHPDFTGPCACRKPDTGMHREAAGRFGLALDRSFYVGDKPSDVVPALTLGGTGLLVRTGYGRAHEEAVHRTILVVDDLGAAARHVVDAVRHRPNAVDSRSRLF